MKKNKRKSKDKILPGTPIQTATIGTILKTSKSPTETVSGTPKEVEFIKLVTIGIVFVLFIGFAGMFVATATIAWEAWNSRAESYDNLQDEIMEYNARMDILIYEIRRGNLKNEVSSTTQETD